MVGYIVASRRLLARERINRKTFSFRSAQSPHFVSNCRGAGWHSLTLSARRSRFDAAALPRIATASALWKAKEVLDSQRLMRVRRAANAH
jgi:hypothetical protein